MKASLLLLAALPFVLAACQNRSAGRVSAAFTGAGREVRLMTLDPGHFHAALVHKYDYDQVDPVVHVYAPDGAELARHLALVERFNTRADVPTHWQPVVYRGGDYVERMLAERPGNVVVLAGDNARKIGYVRRAVAAGIHVLADKPMVIVPDSFDVLVQALALADEKGLLVADIMTERYEIASNLQRALSRVPGLFGQLAAGSPGDPAVTKESVHHFYKTVAGQPLVRPAWFFDVGRQGEGIVDVSTHLVDLILWQAFPDEPIDYADPTDDVRVLAARRWDTRLTPEQFTQVTGEAAYPAFLQPYVGADATLAVAANGAFDFSVRGVHARVSVRWDYENPGGGDTHYSVMRGTRARLVIRQDAGQGFVPTLYVEPAEGVTTEDVGTALDAALASLGERYPGLTATPAATGWKVEIPDRLREGHEEHFTRVTEQYLQHLVAGRLPTWERTNLLTKYFVTTRAYAMSR